VGLPLRVPPHAAFDGSFDFSRAISVKPGLRGPPFAGAVESYPAGLVVWVSESAGDAFFLFDQPVVALGGCVIPVVMKALISGHQVSTDRSGRVSEGLRRAFGLDHLFTDAVDVEERKSYEPVTA